MKNQLISLKPKPTIPSTEKPPTNFESNPAYSDKNAFPTIVQKDDLPVKQKSDPKTGDDDNHTKPTPRYSCRRSTDTRTTQRGYSAHHTAGRARPPRVSRYLESKFHALERSQKNLIQQTKLEGQLEYLTISRSSSGKFWITVEGSGQPFIRIPFDTTEYCFEAALELEDTFDMLQVIEVRPPETIERIEEMVGVYLVREQVARIWG